MPADVVSIPFVQWSVDPSANPSSDNITYEITTSDSTYDAPIWMYPQTYTIPTWSPVPQPTIITPEVEEFLRRGLEQNTVQTQDIPLPEGLEMIDECQIRGMDQNELTLEFHIKGPTLPLAYLGKIPEVMFKKLDEELKMAVIRAFRLIPKSDRPRTIIIEEE